MAIEYTVLNYLNDALSEHNINAYLEEPYNPEDSYVLVEKTGSSENNRINLATFAIQSYGKSLQDAIDLNELVKEIMDAFPRSERYFVFSCTLNSDYNFTDTETQRYRYQAVFEISF